MNTFFVLSSLKLHFIGFHPLYAITANARLMQEKSWKYMSNVIFDILLLNIGKEHWGDEKISIKRQFNL